MLKNLKALAALPSITLSLHMPAVPVANPVPQKPTHKPVISIKTDTKLLAKLPPPAYEPIAELEPIYVNKLRPLGTYANDYAPGNCTWYVASRLPVPNSMGNANNWAYSASIAGLSVSNVPRVGSVAQTAGDSWLGHVAIVESINTDGSFIISEMNYQGYDLVDSRTTTTAEFPNFIYI